MKKKQRIIILGDKSAVWNGYDLVVEIAPHQKWEVVEEYEVIDYDPQRITYLSQ